MPQIESELMEFRECVCFAIIDFVAGYWQLALDESSQEFHSIITPFGVYSPTRTLQGARNSASNFQSRVELCFSNLGDRVKAWCDDFIVATKSETDHVKTLREFFKICEDYGLKISARKSSLFVKEVKWCAV